MMTILEAIDARHSVWAYQDKPIDEEIRKQLDAFLAECNQESGSPGRHPRQCKSSLYPVLLSWVLLRLSQTIFLLSCPPHSTECVRSFTV